MDRFVNPAVTERVLNLVCMSLSKQDCDIYIELSQKPFFLIATIYYNNWIQDNSIRHQEAINLEIDGAEDSLDDLIMEINIRRERHNGYKDL